MSSNYIPKPSCYSCEHSIYNRSFATQYFEYKNSITNRKGKLLVKAWGRYCQHPEFRDDKGKPRKINRSHVKWWGFTPSCSKNPYKHYCSRCGKRMATDKTMCSSCKKESQYY